MFTKIGKKWQISEVQFQKRDPENRQNVGFEITWLNWLIT